MFVGYKVKMGSGFAEATTIKELEGCLAILCQIYPIARKIMEASRELRVFSGQVLLTGGVLAIFKNVSMNKKHGGDKMQNMKVLNSLLESATCLKWLK